MSNQPQQRVRIKKRCILCPELYRLGEMAAKEQRLPGMLPLVWCQRQESYMIDSRFLGL
jgi:hypothetical protein